MIPDRDTQILRERFTGATLAQIGEHHGMSAEGARKAVQRAGSRMIDAIHLDLLKSHATGELPTFLIPDHAGPDFDEAMEMVQFVTSELDARGMVVRVHYRPVHNGIALALEDSKPPANSATRRRNYA